MFEFIITVIYLFLQCWADWKSTVKKQQAAVNRFNQATGNRPATEGPPPLEGMDKEVLEFFPAALVGGDGGTIESGFQEVIYVFI